MYTYIYICIYIYTYIYIYIKRVRERRRTSKRVTGEEESKGGGIRQERNQNALKMTHLSAHSKSLICRRTQNHSLVGAHKIIHLSAQSKLRMYPSNFA